MAGKVQLPKKGGVRRVWRSVGLMIGFHRDPKGKRRDKAHVWSPPDATAAIRDDISDAEVFCVVKSASGERAEDVQIKLHPDKIVLRRDLSHYWKGIVVSEYDVQVRIGDIWVRIGHDGTIMRQTDFDTTFVEADGSVLKETQFAKASMSPDGTELTSSTGGQVSIISPTAIMQRQRDDGKDE